MKTRADFKYNRIQADQTVKDVDIAGAVPTQIRPIDSNAQVKLSLSLSLSLCALHMAFFPFLPAEQLTKKKYHISKLDL